VERSLVSCSLMVWSSLKLCSATADLSGWANLICRPCSFILSWTDRPLCPMYTLPHSQGIIVNCLPVGSVLVVYDSPHNQKTPITWLLFCFAPGAPSLVAETWDPISALPQSVSLSLIAPFFYTPWILSV